jgi:hypothetical protein
VPLWSLGTHVLVWALTAGWMVFRFGGRRGPAVLGFGFLGLAVLRQQLGAALDFDFDFNLPPWLLCALAGATLWVAWVWALPRIVARLSDPGQHVGADAAAGDVDGAPVVAPPHDLRWIAMPAADAVIGTRRDRLNLAIAPLSLLLLGWVFGTAWAATVVIWVVMLGSTATPWVSGAWVSPRWACLPGAPARGQTASALRSQARRRGLPRAAALAALSVLCVGLVAGAGGDEMLALWCLSMAVAWVSADVALAAAAWRKVGHRGAVWPMLGAGGFLLATLAVQHGVLGLPLGFGPALWAWAALAWGGALPTAWLLARLSAPAWARYDWSSMPRSPWPGRAA